VPAPEAAPGLPPEQPPGPPNVAPPRARGKRPAPSPPAAPPQQPAAASPTAPAQPAPQLAEILTPQQQQDYNRTIDARLERARRNLGLLKTRTLTPEQQVTADRIQTFIRQAGEARKDDLAAARNLAERADLLADDLIRSLE